MFFSRCSGIVTPNIQDSPMKVVKLAAKSLSCRLLVIGLGLGWLVLLPPRAGFWPERRLAHAQQDDAFDEAIDTARDLLKRKKYDEALKAFKRANDLHEKKDIECYLGMAQAYQGLEAFKNVVESCDKVIELAGNNTQAAGLACNLKGVALQSQSEGKDQKKLLAAEAAFRQGLSFDSHRLILHYNLGTVLMQQGRDPEGIAELNEYVKLQPSGSFADDARQLIANPRRAREPFAPDFSITTSEGEYISSDELRGKVVLLDFWGTWCAPCVASVPALRSLNKRYAKDPSFVMIGISTDNEAGTWRSFTAENKMIWPQYLDRDKKVVRTFNVRSFPTYILIDHEGVIRFRSVGTSWERSGNLDETIRKHLKAVAKSSPAE
jgi:thiol-disulfide isomerase/thioredoxin